MQKPSACATVWLISEARKPFGGISLDVSGMDKILRISGTPVLLESNSAHELIPFGHTQKRTATVLCNAASSTTT